METSDFKIDVTSSHHTNTFENKEYAGVSFEHSRSGGRITKKFIDCTFTGYFKVIVVDIVLEFENCSFVFVDESMLDVRGGTVEHVKFNNCKIKGDIHLGTHNPVVLIDTSITGGLRLIDGLRNNVWIENTTDTRIGKISVGKWHVDNKQIEFRNLNVGELKFDVSVPRKIRLWNGKYDRIQLDDARNLNNLQIWGDNHEDKKIEIGELTMKFLNLEGDILLKFAEIKKINITPFNCKTGSMRWQGLVFTEEVRIEHSNLENVQWNGVNFKNAKLIFDWSMFSKLELANITWPKNRQLYPYLAYRKKDRPWWISWLLTNSLDRNEEERYGIQREIYRQLKSVSTNNQNNIDALAFYKNEMRVYWSFIRLKGGENWLDQILIFLNRVVSDFGQSWTLPLLWLFTLSTLYYFKLDAPEFSWYPGNWWNGFLEMLSYLNPFRKIDESLSKSQIGFDVLFRVVSAYFIYHFIKATRKFGKV